MTRIRGIGPAIALALLAPSVLAADADMLASSLVLEGEIAATGDLAALFFIALRDGASWEATADDVTLHRQHATYRAVYNPLNPEYHLASHATEWEKETIGYGAGSLTSTGTTAGGAMLVLAPAGEMEAHSQGAADIVAVVDPEVGPRPNAEAKFGDPAPPEISARLAGEYLNMTFTEGVFTLRGDLVLEMWGPGYEVAGALGDASWQTGASPTTELAHYQEGTEERHTVHLRNAVLQLRSGETTSLFTRHPTVTVDGAIRAPDAEGALVVGDRTLAPASEGGPLEFAGAATLQLSPLSGRIAATAPGLALASSAAIAPQGPPFLALTAGAVLALAAVAGAIAALARRRLRGDELDVALAAMAEHRWEDALPPLTRLARRDPANAHVLVDRALCLEQVGRFEEAARGFEAALRAAPRHAEAHFYYARTLAKMREREAARAHLEEALERDPRLVEMVRGENVLKGL